MSGWLLSIAGIVIIGALIEVLLTDSSIHKFVRSIYAFFMLFVIAQPIPAFFRDTVAVVGAGATIELDIALIEKINSQTATAVQRNTMIALETAGFSGVIVTVETDTNANFRIKAIYINALAQDIDKKPDIIKIVSQVANVSEEVIHYVG